MALRLKVHKQIQSLKEDIQKKKEKAEKKQADGLHMEKGVVPQGKPFTDVSMTVIAEGRDEMVGNFPFVTCTNTQCQRSG